jgi:hypothetical protein
MKDALSQGCTLSDQHQNAQCNSEWDDDHGKPLPDLSLNGIIGDFTTFVQFDISIQRCRCE